MKTILRGFTLLETVVVLALMLAVTVAFALLYMNFANQSASIAAVKNTASDARTIVTEVENLTLPASQVLASYTFSGTTYSSGATTLVLEIPSIDSTGAVISNKFDHAVIFLTGSTAKRILTTDASSSRVGSTKQLGTNVSSLGFTYDNADFTLVTTVTVDAQTSATVKGKSTTGRIREQVRLRN